jgi:CBS domain-containing protein
MPVVLARRGTNRVFFSGREEDLMTVIRDIMIKDPIALSPDETVLEASVKMREKAIGTVLVVDHGRLVGLFSERDLLRSVIAVKRDPSTTRLGSVCTKEVVAIEADQGLKGVLAIFRAGRFRHLPVVENGKPVGILSTRDFLDFLVGGLERYIEEKGYRRELAEGVDPYDHLGGSYGQ